ncbi:MAG: hypothetical protein QOC92_2201 [Acidimicrobiaceae bacterium]
MTEQRPARRSGAACARALVGTKLAYDGAIMTIVEVLPTRGGYELLVEDRNGKRRYRVALSDLVGSGCAATTGEGQS